MSIELTVDYRCLEGWWVATSEQLDGLIVAHQDLDVVRAEVPLVIRASFQAQYREQWRQRGTAMRTSREPRTIIDAPLRRPPEVGRNRRESC